MGKKVLELRQEITTKTGELDKKIEARDVAGAKQIKAEIEESRELLKLAEEQEERELQVMKTKKNKPNPSETISEMRSIVKSVMGKELSTEERAVVKTVDNSAVLPKQFINELQEIKKGYGSLRGYCDVIPVTKNEGTIPVVDLDQNDMPKVAEGDNIVEGSLVTTEMAFKCAKHGLLQTLTSELVEDAEIEIENICKKNFVEIVTRVENTKIIDIIKANATDASGNDGYEDLETAMDTAIPQIKSGLITLTNAKGYAHLKNKKDANGRKLGLVTEMNGKYYFNGKELVVADDSLVVAGEGKTQIFYSLSMKEAVKITPRKEATVAKSTEAGFSNDTVKLRVLERVGVQKGIVRSIKKIEF
ncbi:MULTISPECIES: phage major capsid protein [Psychrilyobacter]|uniref:Phage major capsid protein n=1 Tax=Psychrilyobacter piezotolerans TaxID=2293438 RepID=A0ABX9KIZ3_9FUSO|nr:MULTISPECIES: phage major capsid protein [Psychrilyobacter]MCS5420765.1 phage major capsid protein [Psychrilyobacter sp. S5]NDI77441.1 phage major capsid protein [Psychrilyobacter piezotolerans]RDE63744.1 phage major capsid protein [Psychrilyobacter sp. S5]REI42088.1 phage major capsid protein [Psychrilyobacter piezotolerans]